MILISAVNEFEYEETHCTPYQATARGVCVRARALYVCVYVHACLHVNVCTVSLCTELCLNIRLVCVTLFSFTIILGFIDDIIEPSTILMRRHICEDLKLLENKNSTRIGGNMATFHSRRPPMIH